jgi:hypothetical protein
MFMDMQLAIPDHTLKPLVTACGSDLVRSAVERLTVDAYRTGSMSAFQVQQLLGLGDRFSTQQWLADRGANENYSINDLAADRQTLEQLVSR